MATCFLDVIPHVIENYNQMVEEFALTFTLELWSVFVCSGFFLVYLIEIFTAKVFGTNEHEEGDEEEGGNGGHGHSHGLPPKKKKKTEEKKENGTRLLEENAPTTNTLTVPEEHQLERHHSHAMEEALPWVVSDEKSNLFKSLTFAVAMSFHSLLEGFALGVQDDNTAVWTLFMSLLLHKCIESFSVGLQISKTNSDKVKIVVATILVYSIMTPLGAVLGTVLQNFGGASLLKQMAIVMLEGMAAGTFIYVTFLEILAPEKFNKFNNGKQFFAIVLGFCVITLLQLTFGHESHGHSHGSVVLPSDPIPSISAPFVYSSPAI